MSNINTATEIEEPSRPEELRPAVAFNWKDEAPRPGDLYLDAFRDAIMEDIDWDAVVWWNGDIAEAARTSAKGGALTDAFPAPWMPDYDETYLLIGRLPRSDMRALDHLVHALSHLVASVEDVVGRPIRVYHAKKGVWLQQGAQDDTMIGTTPVIYLDTQVAHFFHALNRGCDLMQQLINAHAPKPKKPPANAPAAAWAQYKIDLDRHVKLQEPLEDAKKLYKAYFNGKFRSIRADLRERLSAQQDSWDSKTQYLVLADCVLDLDDVKRRGVIDPILFSPEHRSTMQIDVRWLTGPKSVVKSEWEKGIEKLIPDPDTRAYLQKRYGAALLGTPEIAGKSMVWQYGVGDTGKSTIQECIAGKEGVFSPYSVQARASALTAEGQRKNAGDLFMAYARGKRFAIMSELDEGAMLSSEVVKSLTGGDTVIGTAKFANSVNYAFTSTIFVSSNHPPAFPSGDTALQNRIAVVPFLHQMFDQTKVTPEVWEATPEERRADPTWKTRMLKSPEGRRAILQWVLEGLVMFSKDDGIGSISDEMRTQGEIFRSDADPVLKLVRSLVGEEGEQPQRIEIVTDAEWHARSLKGGDCVTDLRLAEIVRERAVELGMANNWGEIEDRVVTSVRSLLNDRGAKRTVVKVDGKSVRGLSRAIEIHVPAPTGTWKGVAV